MLNLLELLNAYIYFLNKLLKIYILILNFKNMEKYKNMDKSYESLLYLDMTTVNMLVIILSDTSLYVYTSTYLYISP